MFRRSLKLAALIAVVFTLGACADGPTAPTESPKLEVEEAPKSCQGTQGAHDC